MSSWALIIIIIRPVVTVVWHFTDETINWFIKKIISRLVDNENNG